MPRWQNVPKDHWLQAKQMRESPTTAEQVLWSAMRRQPDLHHVRRQHLIGPYIADFVLTSVRLIIEVDGDEHTEPHAVEHDTVRDEYLRSHGYRVKRYSNHDVVSNLKGVLQDILREISAPPLPPR